MIIDAHSGKIITKNERNVNDYFEKTFIIFFLQNKTCFQFFPLSFFSVCASISIIDAQIFLKKHKEKPQKTTKKDCESTKKR